MLCLSEVLANLFKIMSNEEFKFLVGLVVLLVGVFFFVSTFLYRQYLSNRVLVPSVANSSVISV